MNNHPIVLPLSAAATDFDQVGGKGANLGELLRGRFPVPDGFVVTTATYDEIAPAGIPELLDKAADGSAVRELIETSEIPAGSAAAIREAYRDLGGGPVAVRSSATAEDLPEAAFAGQQDTYLNVIGAEAVLDAVRRCWASLWTERAISYRQKQGVQDAKIAVVVQRMVTADFAGVMFTANPVSGARDEVVIDASAGLGEAVVSGLVTPDHYVLRKHRLKQVQRGRHEVAIRPLPGGGTEVVSGPSDDELPQAALKRLSKLGKAIERHFGTPQDIEWAWADGRIHILQARPITALPEPPSKRDAGALGPVTMAELLPIRPYPLDVTTWTGALFEAVRETLKLAGTVPPMDRIRTEEDGVLVRWDMPVPRPGPGNILMIPKIVTHMIRCNPRDLWADPVLTRLTERVRSLDRRDLSRLDWDELHATLREALIAPSQIFELRLRYMPRTGLGFGYILLVLSLMGQKDRLNTLFTTDNVITIEINRRIESLAAEIRADPELSEVFGSHEPPELLSVLDSYPFAAEFRDFMDRYGNRETISPALATQPTWSAAPEVVLGILKGFAAVPPSSSRDQSAAAAVREQILGHRFFRPLATRALGMITLYVRILEDTHFYLTLPLPLVRRVMLEFGRRLTEEDLLDVPEDVFHLRLDEVQRAPGRREIVERRKAKRASLEGTPFVDSGPRGGTDTPREALLSGMSGSPGVAEGPARIIRDAQEFGSLRTGEVLVAPYTNPAWTPLFQRAAAVVVDIGGPTSHAAIVAREYGIPAVMGTGDGTTRLTDGQLVRVDGNRGAVLPVE